MIEFIQLNEKKAFIAAVELSKRVKGKENYIALVSEPYTFKNIIRSAPYKSRVINGGAKPRAAIIVNNSLNIIAMQQLTTSDCAVGLLSVGSNKILIASVYLDIKEQVIRPFLENIIKYANKKNYRLIVGMDSNAHSQLYGHETNARGEDLEQFIINNALFVENIGLNPTFVTKRGDQTVESIIDVTLSRGLRNMIQNWRVCQKYNGSDHTLLNSCWGKEWINKRRSDCGTMQIG